MAETLNVERANQRQESIGTPAQAGPCYLATMPLDVFLQVLERLPKASHVALALTSKSFLTSLYPDQLLPILSKEDLIVLLLLLEKDNPSCFLCFDCNRLRPFNPHHKLGWQGQKHQICSGTIKQTWGSIMDVRSRPSRRSGRLRWRVLSREKHNARPRILSWRPQTKGLEVTFSEAHLVMNRYLYGENHGISIRSLQHHFDFERFISFDVLHKISDHFPLERHAPGGRHLTRTYRKKIFKHHAKDSLSLADDALRDVMASSLTDSMVRESLDLAPILPWNFKHSYTSKIVDEELYLASFHHVTGPAVSVSEFNKLLDYIGLKVCRHLFLSHSEIVNFWQYGWWHLTAQVSGPPAPFPRWQSNIRKGAVGCEESVGSCEYCFTDYAISIRGLEGKVDWNLELSTYHRLGSCRRPDDPVWRGLTEEQFSLAFRLDHPEFGPGEVRRRWLQGHGGDVHERTAISSVVEVN